MNEVPAPNGNNNGNGNGAEEALAFKRFMVLNCIRIAGVVTVCVGLAVLEGLIPLPPVFSYILVIAGFLTFFFLPNRIAKGWRSDDA